VIKTPDIEICGLVKVCLDELAHEIMVLAWNELKTCMDEEGCGAVFASMFFGNGEKS